MPGVYPFENHAIEKKEDGVYVFTCKLPSAQELENLLLDELNKVNASQPQSSASASAAAPDLSMLKNKPALIPIILVTYNPTIKMPEADAFQQDSIIAECAGFTILQRGFYELIKNSIDAGATHFQCDFFHDVANERVNINVRDNQPLLDGVPKFHKHPMFSELLKHSSRIDLTTVKFKRDNSSHHAADDASAFCGNGKGIRLFAEPCIENECKLYLVSNPSDERNFATYEIISPLAPIKGLVCLHETFISTNKFVLFAPNPQYSLDGSDCTSPPRTFRFTSLHITPSSERHRPIEQLTPSPRPPSSTPSSSTEGSPQQNPALDFDVRTETPAEEGSVQSSCSPPLLFSPFSAQGDMSASSVSIDSSRSIDAIKELPSLKF